MPTAPRSTQPKHSTETPARHRRLDVASLARCGRLNVAPCSPPAASMSRPYSDRLTLSYSVPRCYDHSRKLGLPPFSGSFPSLNHRFAEDWRNPMATLNFSTWALPRDG